MTISQETGSEAGSGAGARDPHPIPGTRCQMSCGVLRRAKSRFERVLKRVLKIHWCSHALLPAARVFGVFPSKLARDRRALTVLLLVPTVWCSFDKGVSQPRAPERSSS